MDPSNPQPESVLSSHLLASPLRKVLFVWPRIPPDTFWSFERSLAMVGKKANIPPLGLLTVAAQLPADVEVRLVDEAVGELTDEAIRWADAVFVSGMIVQHTAMKTVIERANRLGVPVVAGGPHASTGFRDLPGVDHFVIGEAEAALPPLLADLERGAVRRAYARPTKEADLVELREWFGEDADLELASERPALLDSLIPRFDLLELDAYRSMAVQFSRGCPVGCEFCDIWTRFGRRTRTRPVEAILGELDALHALGWTGALFIVDDNFIGNPARAADLLRELVAWQLAHGHPFSFFTESTLVLADRPDLLALMREAGFELVFIGIESPSQESLVETGKKVNRVHKMDDQVATIQAAGIQVSSGFIIGFDNDPPDIAPRMIDFVNGLGVPMAMVGLLTALPATELQRRLETEGRMLHRSNGGSTHVFHLNFVPLVPEAEVVQRYKDVLEALYPPSMAAFYERCATYRARWTPNPWLKRRSDRNEILGALRSLWVIGTRRHGPRYFQFLLGTLIRKPAFFPTAVRLGVQGHHLREITRMVSVNDRLVSYFDELRAQFAEKIHETRAAGSIDELLAFERRLLRRAHRRVTALERSERARFLAMYEGLKRDLEGQLVASSDGAGAAN